MTTTNIAGIEIPDTAIAEAVNVADELRPLFNQLEPLLDRAQIVANVLEKADRERVPERSDDQWEAIELGTGYGAIADMLIRARRLDPH